MDAMDGAPPQLQHPEFPANIRSVSDRRGIRFVATRFPTRRKFRRLDGTFERQNLSMQMGMPRFTRLTNAFSKKLENHMHALSIYFMHYGNPPLIVGSNTRSTARTE